MLLPDVVLELAVPYGHTFLGRGLLGQWEGSSAMGANIIDWLALAGNGDDGLWFVCHWLRALLSAPLRLGSGGGIQHDRSLIQLDFQVVEHRPNALDFLQQCPVSRLGFRDQLLACKQLAFERNTSNPLS